MAARKKAKRKTKAQARAEFGKRKVDYSTINPETNPGWVREYHGSIQELHTSAKDADLKKAALEYAKTQKLDLKALRALDDRDFRVVGKYATVKMGGGVLPGNVEECLLKAFGRLVEEGKKRDKAKKAEKKEAEAQNPFKPTVQDRIREQVFQVTADWDEYLELLGSEIWSQAGKQKPDVTRDMQAADFKPAQTSVVIKIYERLDAELKEALAGKDEQLNEGYGGFERGQIALMSAFVSEIIAAANMLGQAKKAARKPRKPRAVDHNKVVSRLKFCKMSEEYKVASINPVEIMGAKELWVFNTKYRKLGRYVAQDESGLGVKGASIVDYSEDKSREKTLRKPLEVLPEVMSAGKVKLRKLLDDIRAVDAKLKGRLNDNVVLLRVVK